MKAGRAGLIVIGNVFRYRNLPSLAAAWCALALGVGATKADTITTFNVSALVNPVECLTCALGGDVVINTTIGSIVSANITFTGLPTVGPFNVVSVPTHTTGTGITETRIRDALFNTLDLFLPPFDLVGYTGGPICNGDITICPLVGGGAGRSVIFLSIIGGSLDLVSGSLTPAPVPIPTALPLFATGLGALGLLAWRRKRKA